MALRNRTGGPVRRLAHPAPAVLVLLGTALMTTGCANFSPDGGMLTVQAAASAELGKDVVKIRNERDAAVVNARVKSLLAKPLTASSAVQVALLNNRGLQAAYSELGISEAEMVEASLPPSPTIALSRLLGSGGYEIERQIVVNLLTLLMLPHRREIAETRFKQAQLRAVETTLRTAAEARRAYYRAVASRQSLKFMEEARASAEAVSDLAKKLGETGAMSKLDQAREHVFYAELSAQLATARLRQRIDRERLVRVLGLWGGDLKLRLPDKLPALPARPMIVSAIEREAVRRRVDLIIAQMEIDILAKQFGLTTRTRFINVLEVGAASSREKEIEEGAAVITKRRGGEVEFQIPIYDFGEARVHLAEETYMRAVHRLIERAVNVRADAREAYQAYRGAYDIAKHYDREILPLRQVISDEMLLNYNAMMKDVFSLVVDARARILANVQAIDAQRDFWLAGVDLQTAIVGGGKGSVETVETPRPTPGAAEPAGH